jgi:hypothetical protein
MGWRQSDLPGFRVQPDVTATNDPAAFRRCLTVRAGPLAVPLSPPFQALAAGKLIGAISLVTVMPSKRGRHLSGTER